jgi:hypothetical protein
MANFDNLMQGLKMFQQGVQEFAVNRAVSDATEQINQLNSQQMDEMEKRQAMKQLSDGLGLRLTGLNASASTVANAVSLAAPKALNTPDSYILEGLAKGSKKMQDIGVTAQTMDPDYILKMRQAQEAAAKAALYNQTKETDRQDRINVKQTEYADKFEKRKDVAPLLTIKTMAQTLDDVVLKPRPDGKYDLGEINIAKNAIIKGLNPGTGAQSDQDVRDARRLQGLLDQMKQEASKRTDGSVPQNLVNLYKQQVQRMKASADARIKKAAEGHATGGKKINPNFDAEAIQSSLLERYSPEKMPQGADSTTPTAPAQNFNKYWK